MLADRAMNLGLNRSLGALGDNWWADPSPAVVDDLGTAQGTTITASPPLSPQGPATAATPTAAPRTDYSGAIIMLAGLLIIAIGESQ